MRKVILATVFGVLIAAPSQAQLGYIVPPGMWIGNNMSLATMNQSLRDAQSGLPNDASASTARASASTRFTPSLERRRANYAAFADKTQRVDPAGAAALRQLVAKTDLVAEMGKKLAPFGLRIDDVADAYTIYWMTAWQAAHGDTSSFTRKQIDAVKAQASKAARATPQLADATAAAKQELAEAMLIQAALIEASVDTYKSDPAMMRRLAAAVRTGASATGIDLDRMTLTPAGFVMRR